MKIPIKHPTWFTFNALETKVPRATGKGEERLEGQRTNQEACSDPGPKADREATLRKLHPSMPEQDLNNGNNNRNANMEGNISWGPPRHRTTARDDGKESTHRLSQGEH